MNAVEIEEAVSALASAPFDAEEFPFSFLLAFDHKELTVKRLRSGSGNTSDVPGAILHRNNIHLAVCAPGSVRATLTALRNSPKTAANKAKFILATDGVDLEAEDLTTGDPLVCSFPDLANNFTFFFALAGISTVRQIKNASIDIKATSRLNKLYVELLKDNPDWASEARRHDLNQFIARLIFCFFAEDTGIFINHLFTKNVEQMSDNQSGNTHEIISELFRAMDTPINERQNAGLRNWANDFPYVNGGLFSGTKECPCFSRIARSYLLRAAKLDWHEINPDIFGSMIQAVADDQERGQLGMHYTSVPNILKVLNPLFLDDLRQQLDRAGDNLRKLRNLRRRLATIRVFDPACGSGNFLVIAYIKMREIEHEIVKISGDNPKTLIPLSNFYGIEIKDFSAEIARLSLLIAEFQCDVRLIGQREARLNVLPLKKTGQICTGNALQMNWLEVCPPSRLTDQFPNDLFDLEPQQNEIDSLEKDAETYICGNPPYLGSTWQSSQQKDDLRAVFDGRTGSWKSLDYVSGWFMKAADYGVLTNSACAFVSTNSICQGQQVSILWSLILGEFREIFFAYTSFKWSNLASYNAGVTVVIVGLREKTNKSKKLYLTNENNVTSREVNNINPYLIPAENIIVSKETKSMSGLGNMDFGSKPVDAGNLFLERKDFNKIGFNSSEIKKFVRRIYGSFEFIRGCPRYCLWFHENPKELLDNAELNVRLEAVKNSRENSPKAATREMADLPYLFAEKRQIGNEFIIAVPAISSENREYLPCGILEPGTLVTNKIYSLYNQSLWNMSIIASRLHRVWIGAVCVRMRTDFSYSNTLGWNTFPVPTLTETNKAELTRCAEDILLAREAHFPATIADLYDPAVMPEDLKRAHDRNDETLERIYIGRRFKNDTERLEKLFEEYTKMTAGKPKKKGAGKP